MTGVQTCALPICFPVTIGDSQEKAIEMTEKVAADVMRRRELKSLAEKQKKEAESAKEENLHQLNIGKK